MANLKLTNFISEVTKRGLARDNRFEVSIKNYELVSLLCESTSLPQLSINTKMQKLFGPVYTRPLSIDYGGPSINFVFLVDREMQVKMFFDAWMHQVINQGEFTVNYLQDYAEDIIIKQLDEQEKVMYRVKLIEAFPIAMQQLGLSNANQGQFHRLAVTFAYRYWESENAQSSIKQTNAPILDETATVPAPWVSAAPWKQIEQRARAREPSPVQTPSPSEPPITEEDL